jgi:hypothetical protein
MQVLENKEHLFFSKKTLELTYGPNREEGA